MLTSEGPCLPWLLNVVRALLPSLPHPALLEPQLSPKVVPRWSPSPLAWLQADTHHSRPREGHLASIGSPLVLGTILVGKGPLEDLPDILHVVHTDSEPLEHGTAEDGQGQSGQSGCHRCQGAWLLGQDRG